ncbi:MAG TPA: hypothetical protein VGB57_12640 [Allosphingosinicella sp.]|jgi:hypothetical protein
MQRVRIGLTGLAFVFLLVVLATILVRPSEEPPLSANTVGQPRGATGSTANSSGEPTEPLAQLGVAPGSAETNNSAAPSAPPVAPAPAR